jgi:anthranilate synthase/aminodeoxychorismate synthase-like glutamine amidotransferase
MIAIIDNYDSFTYNLVQYLGELGAEVMVFRNDAISVDQLEEQSPSHLIVSPGPGGPASAGISNQALRDLGKRCPTLGVCLGHQCIGAVFGGKVVRASRPIHGKTSQVHHNGEDLFLDIPNPFEATRYHSLIVVEPLPKALEATAYTSQNEIMALRHREYPIFGVQFHPEAVLTQYGKKILNNFLSMTV